MITATARDSTVEKDTIRAIKGETVWIMLSHVKADKWDEHLHYVKNILFPAAEQASPEAFRHSRFLHATEPDEDGSYASVFIMDPPIEGADYTQLSILTRVHGKEKAEEYVRLWDESLATPQEGYELLQTI